MSKKFRKTEIEPEEILLDKEAASKLETPLKEKGFSIAFILAVLILASFWCRAYWLQIKNGNYYSDRSNKNSIRLYRSRATRGIIYDQNNKPLTVNEPNFTLMVIPADLPKGNALNSWIMQVAKILKKSESEISDFVKNLNKNSTEPVPVDLPLNQDALVELEANLPGLPALFINQETQRRYEDSTHFSQLLGYIGRVSANELKSDPYYSPIDFVGRSGLEELYETNLRGEPGKIAVSVNSGNKILNTLVVQDPASGNNLNLSIDSDLQKLIADTLKERMAITNSPGAAAVVVNVHSGEIQALISEPSIDNNIFTGSLSGKNYQDIVNDKTRPLFNRAINGTYPSGSTIKPFIAAAALAEKIIDPKTKIDDTLGYIQVPNQYNPNIIYTYHDWRANGWVDMRAAIAWSADVYFYEIGGGYQNIKGLGIDRIKKYLNLFGFGSELGIDLPSEASGLIPDPMWKKSVKNQAWYTGDTYNVSIGQGDVLVTPLQMADGIAAIANGGTLWRPKVVSKITDANGHIVKEFKSEMIRSNFVNPSDLQIVKEGMRQAVTNGSAGALNNLPIEVAGKTGTAQVTNTFRKTNAWFTGFAPYNDPDIALAIVIEGAGEGSAAAVPVAKQIFEWYYEKNYDKLNKQ